MRLTGWLVILGSLTGCGGDDSSPAVDGGAEQDGARNDGSSADGTMAADGSVVTPDASGNGCGTGVVFTNGRVRVKTREELTADGATVTPSSCPTKMFLTDANGRWNGEIGQNVPYYLRTEKAGLTTGLTIEHPGTTSGSTGEDAYLFDTARTPNFFTELDSTHAAAWVELSAPTTGACAGRDGWVVSLAGHPEAHVRYITMLGMADPSLTASVNGLVSIMQITPGAPATITATKGACTMNFTIANLTTGRVPLEANAITFVQGFGP